MRPVNFVKHVFEDIREPLDIDSAIKGHAFGMRALGSMPTMRAATIDYAFIEGTIAQMNVRVPMVSADTQKEIDSLEDLYKLS